ncbi:MAG: biotin--[acetyl-CoA-carboxylase] ligase [Desulfuromonadaceae bacterium]|nr:biotin--[acetyl-CoA-carboxylase] ligase [Desulfuromonadaceae bacterium]MDD2856192.1 biotin--[acetyl-CoA-carboxylase] ligase [Desulfuromonadaceae bacterium]
MNSKSLTILNLFRSAKGYISGQHISRELGISRTAVWKRISVLRRDGYMIEALPSQGYRLVASPDLIDTDILKESLQNCVIGSRIEFSKITSSTNADAFRLAEHGAAEGTVFLAESQTGGKGRRGRVWASPAGVNLYCSIVLRPSVMPHEAPQLTFLSAVAVARAIELTTKLSPEIKWPNDLLISGKKVAGLLNEMSAETDCINFVILGIGVNINMTADQFPEDLRHPATSLFLESGVKTDRSRFTEIMLTELDLLYTDFMKYGFEPIREEWQKRCNAKGCRVMVTDSGTPCSSGRFEGIDSDGAMLLRTDDEVLYRITSGDVRII